MLSFGPLSLLAPVWLLPLAALPILWWWLRLTPPAPRVVNFPALRLLQGLQGRLQTASRMPWWLLLLRCLLLGLLLLALTQPVLNARTPVSSTIPLTLLVEDSWAAGHIWPDWQAHAAEVLEQAERSQRPIRLLYGASATLSGPLRASDALQQLRAHTPVSWPSDRKKTAALLSEVQSSELIIFSDGVASASDNLLAETINSFAHVNILMPPTLPLLLRSDESGRNITVQRFGSALPVQEVKIRASAQDGRTLYRLPLDFAAGQNSISATLDLPAALRAQAVRYEIEGENHAGAVWLRDALWQQRPVGIAGGEGSEEALTGEAFYLQRALQPYAQVKVAPLATLLETPPALIILPDSGSPSEEQQRTLITLMQERGAILLRFAGPKLAAAPDELLPAALRSGIRSLGGALSWTEPLTLGSFGADTPLSDLPLSADVSVSSMVLADPTALGEAEVWATLKDGTPLITARAYGKGWLILIHTTATAQWTTLPLSGNFVGILRRVLDLASGQAVTQPLTSLPPLAILTGFGQLSTVTSNVQPVPALQIPPLTAIHPPGFYGTSAQRIARNTGALLSSLQLYQPPKNAHILTPGLAAPEHDLQGALLASAMILLLIDILISLRLRGLLLLALFIPTPLLAQDLTEATRSAAGVWLAYIETGDITVDEQSARALAKLRISLQDRTAVEPLGVRPLDPAQADLSLYPLIYWPITANQPSLSKAAQAEISKYLATGGVLVLDTQDEQEESLNTDLSRLTRGLQLPPLMPLPPDHVLTRSYYLLSQLPVWVEQEPAAARDGVTSVIVTSSNLARLWTEPNTRAGEQTHRLGVNLMLMALTGNYKSDQVHIQTLLDRLEKR